MGTMLLAFGKVFWWVVAVLAWPLFGGFIASHIASEWVVYKITDASLEKRFTNGRLLLTIPLQSITKIERGSFLRSYLDPPITWAFTNPYRTSLWISTVGSIGKHLLSPPGIDAFENELRVRVDEVHAKELMADTRQH